MLKEFSCGAIIYKIVDKEPLFLLVYSKRNNEWGFPKGHIEKSETEIDTARREVFEETGISKLEFINNFRVEDIYETTGTQKETYGKTVEKHSVYFLALALDEPRIYKNDEIETGKWFNISEAFDKLKFNNKKKAIKDAYEVIIKEYLS